MCIWRQKENIAGKQDINKRRRRFFCLCLHCFMREARAISFRVNPVTPVHLFSQNYPKEHSKRKKNLFLSQQQLLGWWNWELPSGDGDFQPIPFFIQANLTVGFAQAPFRFLYFQSLPCRKCTIQTPFSPHTVCRWNGAIKDGLVCSFLLSFDDLASYSVDLEAHTSWLVKSGSF